jgi:hypothetical protein
MRTSEALTLRNSAVENERVKEDRIKEHNNFSVSSMADLIPFD